MLHEGRFPTRVPLGIAISLVLFAGLSSCAGILAPPLPPEPAPEAVRSDALLEAIRYIGMEYEWGGQDIMPRGIDCSGLVVNVYGYAAGIHGYSLPFTDSTAANLHDTHSIQVISPEPGDLIFLGAVGEAGISHVAICDSVSGGQIWVIDSTFLPESGINGVSRRSYPEDDPRIRTFGRLLVIP